MVRDGEHKRKVLKQHSSEWQVRLWHDMLPYTSQRRGQGEPSASLAEQSALAQMGVQPPQSSRAMPLWGPCCHHPHSPHPAPFLALHRDPKPHIPLRSWLRINLAGPGEAQPPPAGAQDKAHWDRQRQVWMMTPTPS